MSQRTNTKNLRRQARFINDGGAPERNNVVQRVVFANGQFHYLLHAARDIEPGEELFFEYGNDYWNTLKATTGCSRCNKTVTADF